MTRQRSAFTGILLPSLASFALAASLGSCASDDRMTGVSTETTNGISVSVRDTSGKPMSRARVTLWDSRGDSMLAQGSTNASGLCLIPLAPRDVSIHVTTPDGAQAAWRSNVSLPVDSIGHSHLTVAPVSELSFPGRARIRLAGTPFQTMSGRLANLPTGSYVVVPDTGAIGMPLGSLQLAAGVSDTFSATSDSGLLVEDFDDGDSTWIWGTLRSPESRWFAQEGPSGAYLRTPLVDEATATPGMDTLGAWRGRSLRIRYTASDTGSFVQVGMYFKGFLDLSKLRSIRVRVKGDGVFRLALHGYAPGLGGVRAHWQAIPGPTWTEFVFRPGEELPAGPSEPPRAAFADLSGVVHILMLQAYGGTNLSIDDIRFDGIEASDIVP